MNIKKTLKNMLLLTLLSAPLSTVALFDFGRDDYYYDRPHLFGGYRHGYYGDRRYQDIREQRELDRLDKEAEILARKEAILKAQQENLKLEKAQQPVVKK